MTATSTLQDIVQQMCKEPKNSTLGWDVVVNYKESEINDLLAHSWSNDPQSHVQELTVEVYSYDQDANQYIIGFHFNLGPPRIKFNGSGTHPSCELYIPINGGQSVTPSQTLEIYASTYEIGLIGLDMGTMSGSAGEFTDSDHPFIFPPQGSESAAVIVDMRLSSESQFSVQLVRGAGPNPNPQVDAHVSDIEAGIRKYFTNPANVSSIQYTLASINPAPPPAGYVTLYPKSFRFAAYHSEKYPTTVLSLFIQTSDDSSGDQVDLQQNWTGQWVHSYDAPPVPDTHSASILFNSTMMHNTVVVPALNASGVGVDFPRFEINQGLLYTIRTHKVIAEKAYEEGLSHFDGFSISLDDDDKALRLTLGQNGRPGQPATGLMGWDYTYKFRYGTTRFVPNRAGGTTSVDDSGTCTVKNSLRKTAAFSSKLSDGTLDMDLNVRQGDWDAPEVNKTADSVFSDVFGTSNPTWFDSSLPAMPSLSLDMGSLNFFLTTNLLMPDQKFIAIDSEAGLRIPHDYYIVGQVAKY